MNTTIAPTHEYSSSNLIELRNKVDADIRKQRIIRARRAIIGMLSQFRADNNIYFDELKNVEKKLDKEIAELSRDNDQIDYLLDHIEYITSIELEDNE